MDNKTLLYVTGFKVDYIGWSEETDLDFIDEEDEISAIELTSASIVTNLFNPNTGQHTINQRPLIMGNWFEGDIVINPRYIVDIREIPKDSPIRRTYDKTWQDAKAAKAGISIVKTMPKNKPPIEFRK